MFHTRSEPDQSFFDSVLNGPRLVLRPYSEGRDFEMIAEMLSDPRITAPMGIPVPKPYLEELRRSKQARAENTETGDWSAFITSDEDEIFVGEVGIASWDLENQIAEVFIAVNPDHAGRAYGRDATSLLMEHIFRAAPLACVRMQTLTSNKNALKLAGSLGFRETGRRFALADPGRGFSGGTAIVLDCRAHQFKPFALEE